MPSDLDDLARIATENRERITTLQTEVARLRERQHDFAEVAAVVRFLAEAVEHQGERIEKLAGTIERSSRRALERPSATVIAQYLAIVVAIAAIAIASTH